MTFALIIIGSIIALGVIAALLSWGDKDEPIIKNEGDCSSCSSRSECKLADLKEEGKRKKEERCHNNALLTIAFLLLTSSILLLTSCSTKKNTANTRWWHAFHARYNTYFNGSQAFIEGSLEKENGNQDDHTNVLVMPGRFIDNNMARKIMDEFFTATFEGGRHQKRVDKIPVK